jgi:ribose transport system permease protein
MTNQAGKTATAEVAKKSPTWLKGDFSELAIVAVFVLIVIYLSVTTPAFLSASNIMAILVATSLIAVVACGQTFVIITGGIDLSAGSVVALSGIVTGLTLHAGVPIPLAVLVGILSGAACGLFNGFSITLFGMSPFIVTLAAMSMARGLAFIIPNGQTWCAGLPSWSPTSRSRPSTSPSRSRCSSSSGPCRSITASPASSSPMTSASSPRSRTGSW